MSNWQKISIVLAGLLVLSCVLLTGLTAWVLTSGPAAGVLSSFISQVTGAAGQPTPNAGAPATGQNLGRRLQNAGLLGVVAAINGDQVKMTETGGQYRNVTIGTGTRIVVIGTSNPSINDIRVGDKLLAIGGGTGANSTAARLVVAAPPTYTQANVRAGTVTSVTGDTLVLSTPGGDLTVHTDGSTEILGSDLQPLPISQLANSPVIVVGKRNNDGTLAGQLIVARPGGSATSSWPVSTPPAVRAVNAEK